MESNEKVLLTPEQAKAMLPETGNTIHTIRNPTAGILIGADLTRERVEKMIDTADVRELAGSQAMGMKHGLCLWKNGGTLFVQTRKEK